MSCLPRWDLIVKVDMTWCIRISPRHLLSEPLVVGNRHFFHVLLFRAFALRAKRYDLVVPPPVGADVQVWLTGVQRATLGLIAASDLLDPSGDGGDVELQRLSARVLAVSTSGDYLDANDAFAAYATGILDEEPTYTLRFAPVLGGHVHVQLSVAQEAGLDARMRDLNERAPDGRYLAAVTRVHAEKVALSGAARGASEAERALVAAAKEAFDAAGGAGPGPDNDGTCYDVDLVEPPPRLARAPVGLIAEPTYARGKGPSVGDVVTVRLEAKVLKQASRCETFFFAVKPFFSPHICSGRHHCAHEPRASQKNACCSLQLGLPPPPTYAESAPPPSPKAKKRRTSKQRAADESAAAAAAAAAVATGAHADAATLAHAQQIASAAASDAAAGWAATTAFTERTGCLGVDALGAALYRARVTAVQRPDHRQSPVLFYDFEVALPLARRQLFGVPAGALHEVRMSFPRMPKGS